MKIKFVLLHRFWKAQLQYDGQSCHLRYCSRYVDLIKQHLIRKSVSADIAKRARNRLCKLRQTKSVAKCLAEFRNEVLTISEMHKKVKIDGLVKRLKFVLRVEVSKMEVKSFDDCSRAALYVDSALSPYGGQIKAILWPSIKTAIQLSIIVSGPQKF